MQAETTSPPRLKGMLWPTIAAVIAFAILVGFGTWQMQRKAWKEDLLAKIAERTRLDPPIDVAVADKRIAAGEDLEYARVRASGHWRPERSLFFFAPGKSGPGYHVYTPLEMAGGRTVLVNRGFVPDAERGLVAAETPGPERRIDIVGLLRRPGSREWFTPSNEPGKNLWYWRDLAAMAAASQIPQQAVIPFFLDAVAVPMASPARRGVPVAGVTRIELPNRHLEYALTWYGLAGSLIIVYVSVLVSRLRNRRAQ